MGRDFAISAATESHCTIEAVLASALKGSRNPALLKPLFRCLGLALGDSHLSDRYSAGIIAAIAGICRNCSGDRRMASAALNSLKRIFEKDDANIRAYAADAACLLGTPQALRFVLRAAEDPEVLRRCGDMEDHIDYMAGLIYAADPPSGLRELGMMLCHPAFEVRNYAANRLLLFGEPGQPEAIARAAHALLARGVREGCFEAAILLRRGYRLAESLEEWPEGFRGQKVARAARSFYLRVKNGGEFAIGAECWRGIRQELVQGEMQRPPRKFAAGPEKPQLSILKGGRGSAFSR